jgi:hypothetical protein
MDENTKLGGAGPALAAHSKDGSTPGPTPASSATGDKAEFHGPSDAQVQQAYGQAVDHLRDFAEDNPIGSLLAAAGVGLVLGMILARR